jgi:LacI family transcriptional regulator
VANCTDTYGRAILRGVTRYANMQRRWLLFKDVENAVDAQKRWGKLDGGIFAAMPVAAFEANRKRCTHAVYCSGGGDPAKTPVIALDDIAAGAQAAGHLLNCGLEKFAFYGFESTYKTAVNRLAGFREAVEARGYSCDVCPIGRPTSEQRASHEHHPMHIDWLRTLPKPVGIFAIDDTNASELAEVCLQAQITVPDHIAIVGVNNDDLLCESAWPPLSSVDADYSRMGYTAAQTLDRLMRNEKIENPLILLPPLGVIQRQSTSMLSIKNADLAQALRFIREHACDPCTVSDVLRHVPVGRRWLERQFVAQLGRTPHDEIVRVRIETAERLLQKSDLDMLEIASRCGFAELKSFYLAFRKHSDTTPAAYRRSVLISGR